MTRYTMWRKRALGGRNLCVIFRAVGGRRLGGQSEERCGLLLSWIVKMSIS